MSDANANMARFLHSAGITPTEANSLRRVELDRLLDTLGVAATDVSWSVVVRRLELLHNATSPADPFKGLPLDPYTSEMP